MKVASSVEIPQDIVWDAGQVSRLSKIMGQTFERKFNALFCEQAGHIPQELPRIGPVCQRCSLYLGGNE